MSRPAGIILPPGTEAVLRVLGGTDAPLGNTDMDQRWRDGSIKEGTFTDPDGSTSRTKLTGGLAI